MMLTCSLSGRTACAFHCSKTNKFITLQREELRARFPGVPGDLVNYFLYVAEEVLCSFCRHFSDLSWCLIMDLWCC